MLSIRKLFFRSGNMKFAVLSSVTFHLFILCAAAQMPEGKGPFRVPYIIEGEDTIPVVNLPALNVVDESDPDYVNKLKAYYRLRYNVVKVYPYARLAAIKMNEMNARMATMKSDREKRKYKKQVEDRVRDDFEEQIKKLSINQGKILIKLIDRETGSSSYELIKKLKGSFNAFFAQKLAQVFGHDLRSEYDPEGEDKAIEAIVKQIESGQISW